MYDTNTNYDVEMTLSLYLMAQEKHTVEESLGEFDSTLGDPNNNCLKVAREIDSLGWNYFLEGRFSQQWLFFSRECVLVRP